MQDKVNLENMLEMEEERCGSGHVLMVACSAEIVISIGGSQYYKQAAAAA